MASKEVDCSGQYMNSERDQDERENPMTVAANIIAEKAIVY
jgi:hypothetical protein